MTPLPEKNTANDVMITYITCSANNYSITGISKRRQETYHYRGSCARFEAVTAFLLMINPLKTKRRPIYLKTHSVPRSKQFSSRL